MAYLHSYTVHRIQKSGCCTSSDSNDKWDDALEIILMICLAGFALALLVALILLFIRLAPA